jgi:cysteinyl-tRNA synthetase
MQFYNTATRALERFEPADSGNVRVYSCGPTVYDYAHIGNFRQFVMADLLKRYLRYRGFGVYHVMNITDVEDRIIARVGAEGESLEQLTGKYTDLFFEDVRRLNIVPADVYPRATDHVEEMIRLIEALVEKRLAYQSNGSVYFRIGEFPAYGEFARLDLAGMRQGARVDSDEYDKDNARDFVLWKAWVDEDGEVAWASPFGKGRPGWHLECSCMSMKYLGESFDIHTGGVDLIFPHHQNEIAQSEGATGKPLARYWLHNEFLTIDDKKMSKSLGNFHRLQDIAETADRVKAYRYLLISNHYGTRMNFTAEALNASASAHRRLTNLRIRLAQVPDGQTGNGFDVEIARAREEFVRHMDEDLNTPRAMASVFALVNATEKGLSSGSISALGASAILEYLDEINQVLGIFYELEEEAQRADELPAHLAELLDQRADARARKDWSFSDELRDKLSEAGIELRDAPVGTTWSWKSTNSRPPESVPHLSSTAE